jgi:hypothetical protein
MKRKNVVLNRPVFAQQVFDSRSLTVLTTLFHRFPEEGDYELTIRRDERVVHRAHVRVGVEEASSQLDLDLATLREIEGAYSLRAGGVMGFYVSQGIARYRVEITQPGARGRRVWMDSGRVVPEGDLFAVTLVRPGVYRVILAEGKGEGEIWVRLPRGERYRPDQAVRITVGKGGSLEPAQVWILSGQSVVFWCTVPASLRVGWMKEEEPAEPPVQPFWSA